MSEVKRYDLGACYAHMYGLDVVECAEGDFVLASDYDKDTKALEDKARNQHARDSAELRDLCSQRDGLKIELWSAKEERDKLAAELAELKAKSNAISVPSHGIALSNSRAGRVYIAGPMTGYENYNFAAFNAEADRLSAQGLHVENPADHGVVEGADWADYLRYDIGRLATCDCICLLQGWSKSKGARLEVHIAHALGMHVLYAEGADHASAAAAPSREGEV